MARKRPSRSKKDTKPKEPSTTDDICAGPCAFTSAGRKVGEVTIKTTTIQFNAVEILNASKGALTAIAGALSNGVAQALQGAFGGKKL